MRMTAHSDYAMRMLIYCAAKPSVHVTISEVAKAYGISKAHLMKIANELVRAGFLQSLRGRNGGLRLAQAASAINVGKVVRLMEQSSPLIECFDRATNTCVIAPACGLKHLLAKADEAFYQQLDTASLAEVMLTERSAQRFLVQT